jgi:hypothetical protein
MTTARRRVASFSGWLLLGLLSASTVSGGTVYDFESCDLGPIGVWSGPVPPTGCDGWYTPPTYLVPGSAQASVHAYSELPPAITADPAGGNNVLGLKANGTGETVTYDRAQHNFDFSQAAEWTVTYDLSALNLSSSGNTYGTNYIGGFSVFSTSGTHAAFIVDNAWDNSSTSSTWSSFYCVYDANSGPNSNCSMESPGSAWTDLLQNDWYSESTVFDENSNRILSVSITDLTTNLTTTFSPNGWYMFGGAAGAQFEPNAFRFSGLGPTNGMLVDNVGLDPVPEPATLFLMGMGFIALIAFRRR